MKKRYLLILAAVVVLAAAAAASIRLFGGDGLTAEEGGVRVYCGADGRLSLAWPETEGAEYRLSVRPEGGEWSEPETLSEPFAELDVSAPFEAKMESVDRASGKGSKRTVEVEAVSLEAPVLTVSVRRGAASLSWTGGGSVYEVCSMDSRTVLADLEETSLDLRFQPDGELELPGEDQPLRVAVRAGEPGKHYVFYGPPSEIFPIRREALLNDQLNLTCEETRPRVFTLRWLEGRGEHYEVQEWRDGGWQPLARVESSEAAYETERLVSGSHHRLRVAAVDLDGSILAAEETEFYAAVDPLYATIWPIMDLNLCKEPKGGSIRKISAGTALCVLEESNGWFRVRYGNDYGYVDSRYCMINLAEYLGDYCSYDITNSYASIFKVHDSAIAKITRQVLPGYEHIQTADGFLVPYLYPCAQKLLTAARAALEDGYRLRIYEAYRPHETTRFLYDTTAAQLNYPALVEQGGSWMDPQLKCRVDLATGLYTDPATGRQVPRSALAPEPKPAPEPEPESEPETPVQPEAPEPTPAAPPTENTAPPAVLEGDSEPQEPPEQPDPQPSETPEVPETAEPLPEVPEAEPPEPEAVVGVLSARLLLNSSAAVPRALAQSLPVYDTYNKIMTDNGRFGLGSFLARVTSAHNRGIALDLTMETLDGQSLTMQSAMHDLSWYSATYRNNDNAKLLAKYMTAVGMNGLSSEWWHFQDDDTRKAIQLNTYLSKGVDASGWTRDDHGWRWRDAAGVPQKNTTVTVDGTRWTFDGEGYLVE